MGSKDWTSLLVRMPPELHEAIVASTAGHQEALTILETDIERIKRQSGIG